jgi:predicted metal-dependent phosphotriesterase family hydrolase
VTDAIHTVLGPVAPEEVVGTFLSHEHLVIDYGELLGTPKKVPKAESPVERQVIENVRAFASSGGGLLVDCTPPGYGRYPDQIGRASCRERVFQEV